MSPAAFILPLQTGIPPVSDALTRGVLELATEPAALPPAIEPAWNSNPLNIAAVLIFTFWMMLNIRAIIHITPALADCLVRWKGSVNLDKSIQLSRERNTAARILFLCGGLLVSRYGLLRSGVIDGLPAIWQTPAIFGVLTAYALLRRIIYLFMSRHVRKREIFMAGHTASYNFGIWIAIAMLLAAGAGSALSIPEADMKNILTGICVFFYIFYLIRKMQIFNSCYHKFMSFLYLCGLELLPTAALTAVAVFS